MPKQLTVAVIGTGYVGLTTGACFAALGHTVICADIDERKVEKLKQGEIPIVEVGLEKLVREGQASGRLSFVLGAENAVNDCDFAYLCLPTPQGADGEADLSFLLTAVQQIKALLPSGAIVVNKSTVPVGSAELVVAELGRSDVAVASNPEFLREGSAVYDFFHPDRLVIGASDNSVAERVAELYADIDAPKLLVETTTSELIKYASNAFLATKISFANSISNLCEAVGADAHQVLAGMGHDKRIGKKFLQPGPGWGGSCFPKDVYALIHTAAGAGYDFGLLKSVIETNEIQMRLIIERAKDLLGGNVEGARIAAWGLAFKAGTDDTRQSPALRILRELSHLGADIQAYDPEVTRAPENVTLCDTALTACNNADLLLVLTEWPEFADVSLESVAENLSHKRILDTRNVIDLSAADALDFETWSVGHAPAKVTSNRT